MSSLNSQVTTLHSVVVAVVVAVAVAVADAVVVLD